MIWKVVSTNVNTPKNVMSPVAREIQKLRERGSADSEIVDHLLDKDGLKKGATPKNNVKEIALRSQDKGDIPWGMSWSTGFVKSHDKLNMIYFHLQKTHGHQTRQGADLLLRCCHP